MALVATLVVLLVACGSDSASKDVGVADVRAEQPAAIDADVGRDGAADAAADSASDVSTEGAADGHQADGASDAGDGAVDLAAADASVDVLAADSAVDSSVDTTCIDTDNDSVCDLLDRCLGEDDRVDLDQNGVPDCVETLVANSQFPSDLGSWTSEGTVSHAGGVVQISMSTTASGISQCIPAEPSTGYFGRVQLRGLGSTPLTVFNIHFYDSNNCSGGSTGGIVSGVKGQSAWYTHKAERFSTQATRSMRVALRVINSGTAQFDNVLIRREDCVLDVPSVDVDNNGIGDCGENRLRNAQLRADTGQWSPSSQYAVVNHSSADADGKSDSGSMVAINTDPSGSAPSMQGATQCAHALSSTSFTLYAKMRTPTGQGVSGWEAVKLRYYASLDCSGAPLGGSDSPSSWGMSSSWTLRSHTFSTPANANSVRVTVGAAKPAGSANLAVNVDNVLLK